MSYLRKLTLRDKPERFDKKKADSVCGTYSRDDDSGIYIGNSVKIIMAGIVGEHNYGALIQYASKNVELDKIDEVKENVGPDFLQVSCAVLLNGNSVVIRFSDEETILDTGTKDKTMKKGLSSLKQITWDGLRCPCSTK